MSDNIPVAGAWGVLASYGFPVVEITRVSEQCFWSRGGHWRGDRETRAYLEKLVCWSPERAAAELASKRLASAESERDRRIGAARAWFAKETDRIAASAAGGRSPETVQQAQPEGRQSGPSEASGDAQHQES